MGSGYLRDLLTTRFAKMSQLFRTLVVAGASVLFISVSTNPASLSRQVRQAIDGFPNGLPDATPLGVRLILENMFGPDGEINMPPIPGEAGVDYPVYNSVPETGFDCSAQTFPGIYTDIQAECQSFYMCQQNGEFNSFLCPNGTIFNQQYFVCDWWYNLDCAAQPDYYQLNSLLYQEDEDTE